MVEDGLRIDKFLWFARLARTRNLARKVAEKGRVRCNGRRIDRAHAVVRVGDTLSVPLPDGMRVIRVESLPERRVSPKLVAEVYMALESITDGKR